MKLSKQTLVTRKYTNTQITNNPNKCSSRVQYHGFNEGENIYGKKAIR